MGLISGYRFVVGPIYIKVHAKGKLGTLRMTNGWKIHPIHSGKQDRIEY